MPDTASAAAFARLRPIGGLERRILKTLRALQTLPREELPPGGGWIMDHGALLLGEAESLRRALRTAPPLPALGKTPRVLELARQIAKAEEGLSPALILREAKAFFSGDEPMQRELHCLPSALALAIFEQADDCLSFCLRAAEHQRRAAAWARRFAAGRTRRLPGEDELLRLGLSCLSRGEEESALQRAALLMRRQGRVLPQEDRQTARDAAAGRAVMALHRLSRLPFDGIMERLNPVAAILREEETYRLMDDAGRACYQQRAEWLSRRFCAPETAVARAAVRLAKENTGAKGQAGYYLLEAPEEIKAYLTGRPARKGGRGKTARFLLPLYLGAPLAAAACAFLGAPWFSLPLIALCASEILRGVYFSFLRRRYPARPLPRLRCRYLKKETRTLAVIPTLLTGEKQALRMASHLAALRCANPDKYLDFLLLADFQDADAEALPEDEGILRAAREAVRALKETSGGVYYLHRARQWNGEKFTGRERKRGALDMLNHLLTDGERTDPVLYSSFPPAAFRGRYKYVITLDADTLLLPGEAGRLVGAMEHPLQKGRIGVIQPRMAVEASSVRTRVQKYLGGPGGAEVYGLCCQDVYQDAFGRGSFVGKGIYQPDLWMDRLRGRLPAGRLLSHDLIEGEIVSSALAGDIVLYDGHPSSLAGWIRRLHRWTRGDWQLLPFLWDRRLDALSHHKIWDNLRRSMLPAARLALLFLSAVLRSPYLLLLSLPWPLPGLLRRLALLPGQAYILLDAAARAVIRLTVTHKRLLEWAPAAQADSGLPPLPAVLFHALCGLGLSLLSLIPSVFWPGAALGMLWLTGPIWMLWLDRPVRLSRPMRDGQKREMRALARDTWRFFEDTVGESTLFLPPDNEQAEPRVPLALRTSPTNAGLYLLSCCAAREMGFISTREMAERLGRSLDTLEKLDVWKGHFYNWYGLMDGVPLPPRFVSTVDSGNLAGCLFACAQICRQRLNEMPESLRDLPRRLDGLFSRMDFAALYDAKEELFYVGVDAESGKPTAANYDLMASEARLTSFLAVMTGQVPRRHWRRLNRTALYAGGGPALLSWGGTMFEYLMPHLLLPLIPGTLMGEGCLRAVRAQMADGQSRPFGVSESGYFAFDAEMNYQYRAFGLPSLAVSGETAGQVTAPYASALALPFFPRAAADNILRMMRLGWRDGHGLFEAADYSRGKKPQLVRSHMAHHQGMILCSICNALENNALVRAFMTPPAARAYRYLLEEAAPRRASRRPDLPKHEDRFAPPGPCRRTARSGFPLDAMALCGGRMKWLIADGGKGYLAWEDRLITRFPGGAASPSGPQVYLRLSADGRIVRPMAEGRARWEAGSAHFFCSLGWGKAALSLCCAPMRDAAVMRLTLENTGRESREIEAVTCLETALSSPADDAAHPNYRDLSVEISPWRGRGLIARRLPRDDGDRFPLVCHLAAGDFELIRCQGDRKMFLGRTGSVEDPEQMHMPMEACRYETGFTLAPCLSLRGRLTLKPGESKTVYFVTLCRDKMEDFTDILFSPDTWRDAFSLAYARDQIILRNVQMQEGDLHLAQQVLGAVLFSGQPHQAKGASAPMDALWRLGVSGTLPVWTVSLDDADRALLKSALRCHAYMRYQGIKTDLILLCPEESQYRRPIMDEARRALSLSPCRGWEGTPGGVTAAAVREDQRMAVESLSRLALRSGRPIREQLRLLARPLPPEQAALADPRPVLPLRWAGDHPYGGFTPEGDYRIAQTCPVPWHNLLCNEQFGTLVCESGILYSYAGNSRLNPVTRRNPDVFRGVNSEEICLRDEEGTLYPLAMPAAVHSPGVTEYSCLCGNVFARVAVFVHRDLPAGVRAVTLRSEKDCTVKLYWTVRFSMGERGEYTRCRVRGGIALSQNGGAPGCAWAKMPAARCRILPEGLYSVGMLDSGESGGGSVAVFAREIALKARNQASVTLLLGWAGDEMQACRDADMLSRQEESRMEREVRAFWQRRLDGLQLFSGIKMLDAMLNKWLPYQAQAARLFARMGPYQPGGAWGFRDQLQDLLVLLHTDPAFARRHILLCAAHQYEEGDVQHWWHPKRRGVRTRISDDRLFLPCMTAQYVKITGDSGILAERTPYLRSLPLQNGERDRYEEPDETDETDTLLGHCQRAVDSVKLGEHGLPLMQGGDWNDGMNRVGGEKGESVWLAFFLALTLREFAPLCPLEIKERYTALRRAILDRAESAWTGKWYLRAWRDDGKPLGGPDTDPPRIDLISQAFAALAGAPRAHAREAVMQALRLLYDREAGIVKLLDPPFSPEENAGYIGAYPPGVRENGGQYTHAVPWLVLALIRMGEYAWAWEIARVLLPPCHGDTRDKAETYRVEPYVLAGDIYEGERRGQGGWTWYTGSAAWLYHVWITALLGFEKRGGMARLSPCPGGGMDEFTLVYRYGSSRWHFTAGRDIAFATLDGEKLPDGWAKMRDDGKTHEARFPMRE